MFGLELIKKIKLFFSNNDKAVKCPICGKAVYVKQEYNRLFYVKCSSCKYKQRLG